MEGDLPTAPTVSRGVARSFRPLLRSTTLSPKAERVGKENLPILELRAADQVARVVEDEEARHATAVAEAQAISGIYVYALPHYLRYPKRRGLRSHLVQGRATRPERHPAFPGPDPQHSPSRGPRIAPYL